MLRQWPRFRSAGKRGLSRLAKTADRSRIGHGFCHQLAQGRDAGKLTHELAARRLDKPNPLYYAQRTIDVASARQWLLDRIPIEDVITMLEVRRETELPAALGSARAREIAATAQRMVARRKIA